MNNKLIFSNKQKNTAIYCILLLVMCFYACTNEKEINALSVGETSQAFHISKADSVAYRVELKKDKLYSFTIEQKGIDVVVSLIGPENNTIKEIDSPTGINGLEQFHYYNEQDESYTLQIKPIDLDYNEPEGKYTIAIAEFSPKTEIVLTKEAYLSDFEAFRNIFENANAGLYRYHTKTEVDSVFLANQAKINNQTTFREFYNLVWDVVDYTGSIHNNLNLPKQFQFSLNRKAIFFPLPLKYIDGKLYSNSDYQTVPVGAEIISVNGLDSNEFATLVSKYLSTDGSNTTEKYKFIETTMLPLYAYYAFGEKEKFTIKYKRKNQVKTVELASVDLSTFFETYNERHSKDYDEKAKGENSYAYEYIDSLNTGLLSVKSFDVGEKGHDVYNTYKSFLDSVFISLEDKENLIVDIRENGGGSGDALMLLTTYLSNRELRENTAAYSLFKKLPYPEFHKGSPQDIEEWLEEYVGDAKEGKYYQNDEFNPVWKPNEHRFQGDFILLIDPFVASAASHFAAHIKSDKKAQIVGEETGGAYYGHTGHMPVSYILPNSKLNLRFSIINLEQDVVELPDEKFGNGVMPDLNIFQTHQDFIDNKDTQLNFAVELIQKSDK